MTDLPGLATDYLPFAGLFLGVLIAFEGLRQTLAGEAAVEETRQDRLRRIRLRGGDGLRLSRQAPRGLFARVPVLGSLPAQMRQAGMTMKPGLFLTLCGMSGLVVFAVWSALFGAGLGLGMAALVGMGLPVAILRRRRQKRLDAFTAQLPDALDLMMRGLRMGHPINATLQSVVQTMPDPIATEFARVAHQIEYGEDLVSAFRALADRMDQEDVHYLAASIGIQHGTGGNLGGILGTLARVIRNRAMTRRRIRALSAEGRLSSAILSFLPLVIFGFTSLTAPGYYTRVQDDPLFLPMAVGVVVLLVANFLTLRKLASFRI